MSREEYLFNKDWYFKIDGEEFKPVEIPHDWLIYDVDNLYKTGTGCYRKVFNLKKVSGKRYLINFDGVYMDSDVYVNGILAGTNRYGYSSFEYDITDSLKNGQNEIKVIVRHVSPNSRWYSGAGIFRDIFFKEVNDLHIATNGVYIFTEPLKKKGRWKITADIELEAAGGSSIPANGISFEHNLKRIVTDKDNYNCISRGVAFDDIPLNLRGTGDYNSNETKPVYSLTSIEENPDRKGGYRLNFTIDNALIWDITSPNLYSLKISLKLNEKTIDTYETRFGLRTVKFTPNRGFLLNGRRVKLFGVCEHHDLGLFGAAFNKDAMRRKFTLLKEMGVNAVRTSHNMPATGFMDLADEMGILVDSESFDMWRRPKTEFDYARFFEENYRKDIKSWVRRDRNRPSVIMWSIGNEIYDCHADESAPALTLDMKKAVEESDYKFNAIATHASNFMAWEGARKCADVLKLAGYNYGERLYDKQHKEHPDWMIYGSETCSTVQSRGVYHFPLSVSLMADDDEQCSSLGNCSTSWGAPNTEYVITMDRDRRYSAGQFIWTGFDYIGEPTPYHTKNSYFGQLDTAGFPKDTYYIFKGTWTDPEKAPFVHIFPYWDFNDGQMIDVRTATNGDQVKLYFNGRLIGSTMIDHNKGKELAPAFRIPYRKGTLKAVALYKGKKIAEQTVSSFDDAVGFTTEEIYHGNEYSFFKITAIDKNGNAVENADNRVKVKAIGGKLIGLDNGDSTDTDDYVTDSRKLFSGKLLAAVRNGKKGVSVIVTEAKEIPIRNIKLEVKGGRKFSSKKKEIIVKAVICPENATYSDIKWVAVNEKAVPVSSVKLESFENENGHFCRMTAKGDGEFILRAIAYNGERVAKVISTLEFKADGIGQAYIDPYNFVSGSLFTDSKGGIGNGNEKGIATPYGDESYVGFENIDFGETGSDEITIPIFTLNDAEYRIGIWEGRPGENGSTLLCDGRYCKKSIWNVYQPETYKLNKKLKGVTSIYFTADDKYHLKGFVFTKPVKAYEELYMSAKSRIYGDTFTDEGDAVTGIGNNVTIEFDGMDFGNSAPKKIVICGRSKLKNNSIHLKFDGAEGVKTELLEFEGAGDYTERIFDIEGAAGLNTVGFVFLPGSDFDFRYFRFIK